MRLTIRQYHKIKIAGQSSQGLFCGGVSESEILCSFCVSEIEMADLGDIVELDPRILDMPQMVVNSTKGKKFTTILRKSEIQDLRLPMTHNASRFPSPERLDAV